MAVTGSVVHVCRYIHHESTQAEPCPTGLPGPENFREGPLQLIQPVKSRAARSASNAQEAPWGVQTPRLPRPAHGWITPRRCSRSCQFGASADTAKQQGLAPRRRLRPQNGPGHSGQEAAALRAAGVRQAGLEGCARPSRPHVLVRDDVSSHRARHALQSRASGSCCGLGRRCLVQETPFSFFLLLGCAGSWGRPWRGPRRPGRWQNVPRTHPVRSAVGHAGVHPVSSWTLGRDPCLGGRSWFVSSCFWKVPGKGRAGVPEPVGS